MSQDNSHLFEKHTAVAVRRGSEITDWPEGYARVEVPIAPHVANRPGIPHGGPHATLMDTAMGFAGCFTGAPDKHQMALTLSMTVNYLGQAQGTRLIAEGHVSGGGRKTYFAKAEVTDDMGNLLATATGVFRYRGTPA